MTTRDRWLFIGFMLTLISCYTVAVYSIGQMSCAGLSFGFY